MKRLAVKKGVECMACLQCVRACSEAFYKEFHQDKACIRIVEKNGEPKPVTCVQCGKCMEACDEDAIVTAGAVKPRCPKKPIPCKRR